jgi:hypothetical protein
MRSRPTAIRYGCGTTGELSPLLVGALGGTVDESPDVTVDAGTEESGVAEETRLLWRGRDFATPRLGPASADLCAEG